MDAASDAFWLLCRRCVVSILTAGSIAGYQASDPCTTEGWRSAAILQTGIAVGTCMRAVSLPGGTASHASSVTTRLQGVHAYGHEQDVNQHMRAAKLDRCKRNCAGIFFFLFFPSWRQQTRKHLLSGVHLGRHPACMTFRSSTKESSLGLLLLGALGIFGEVRVVALNVYATVGDDVMQPAREVAALAALLRM